MSGPAVLEPELAHRDAIAVLLVAELAAQGSQVAVYVDQVPDAPDFPYLVIWAAAGTPDPAAERLAGWAGEITTSHQITAAGLSVDDVIGAAGRCRYALHRRRPVIPGRRCGDLYAAASGGRPALDPQPAVGGQRVYSLPVFVELHSSLKRE